MIKLRSKDRCFHASKTCLLLCVATLAIVDTLRAGQEDTTKETRATVIQQPPPEPKFFVEAGAAGEFDYHATHFISNGSADFGTLGVYNLPAKIQSRDFTSTHDVAAIDGRLRLGYIINPILTVYTIDFMVDKAGSIW